MVRAAETKMGRRVGRTMEKKMGRRMERKVGRRLEKKNGENSCVEREVHTRPLKLDFPKFDGSEPNNWILKAQQFHSYYNTSENQKVFVVGFHMEGRALTWYHWLMDAGYAGGMG